MKTKILISLIKTTITWMVENCNPCANVALFILCLNESVKDLKWVGEIVRGSINSAIRRLSDAGAQRFNEQEIN